MVVGITGQTGSGKSTVVKMLGFAGIDADKVAHEVLREKEVKVQLCERFGDDILDEQGEICRPALAKKAFASPAALSMLGAITYPVITKRILDKIDAFERQGESIIMLDAPTLYESGADKMCGKVVFVTADREVRKHRIMARDGLTEQAAELRLSAQKTDDFYKSADFKIINNGQKDELEKAVQGLKNTLLKLTEEK